MFDCWLVTALTTITVEKHSTVATTLMTSSLLADLSCVSMESGVLPVKTIGTKNKLVLSAANWDLLVSVSIKVFVFKFCTRDGLLSFLGAIAGNQQFQLTSSTELPVYNRSYSCKGSELHLRDCPSFEPNRTEPCGYRRNAYIVCQGKGDFLLKTTRSELTSLTHSFTCA